MFGLLKSGEKEAVLVHVDINTDRTPMNCPEFQDLALVEAASWFDNGRPQNPDPRYYLWAREACGSQGIGRCSECRSGNFQPFTLPSQERNLEKELACRVVDRTGLILDIFAQQARS